MLPLPGRGETGFTKRLPLFAARLFRDIIAAPLCTQSLFRDFVLASTYWLSQTHAFARSRCKSGAKPIHPQHIYRAAKEFRSAYCILIFLKQEVEIMPKKQPERQNPASPTQPKVPTPSIKPERNTPGFVPAKSPEISTNPSSPEINPGRHAPEVQPQPSPDATPSKTRPEIPPHNDPYSGMMGRS